MSCSHDASVTPSLHHCMDTPNISYHTRVLAVVVVVVAVVVVVLVVVVAATEVVFYIISLAPIRAGRFQYWFCYWECQGRVACTDASVLYIKYYGSLYHLYQSRNSTVLYCNTNVRCILTFAYHVVYACISGKKLQYLHLGKTENRVFLSNHVERWASKSIYSTRIYDESDEPLLCAVKVLQKGRTILCLEFRSI